MENQWILKSSVFCLISGLTNLMSRKLVSAFQLDIHKSWQIRNVFTSICHSVAVTLLVAYALMSRPDLFQDIINKCSGSSHTAVCMTVGYHLWDLMDVIWNKWNGKWTNLVMVHHCGLFLMMIPAAMSMKMIPFICIGLVSMAHESIFMFTRLMKMLNHTSNWFAKVERWANYTVRFLNWFGLFCWSLLNFHRLPNGYFIILEVGTVMVTPINMLDKWHDV